MGACAPHGCFRSTVGSSVAQLGRSKHNGGRKGLTKGACRGWRELKGNPGADRSPSRPPLSALGGLAPSTPGSLPPLAQCLLEKAQGQAGRQEDPPWFISLGFNSRAFAGTSWLSYWTMRRLHCFLAERLLCCLLPSKLTCPRQRICGFFKASTPQSPLLNCFEVVECTASPLRGVERLRAVIREGAR